MNVIDDADLQRLFDAALDALVGMDEAGRVIAWNAHAESLFGWSRAEAMQQYLGDLIVPPEMREAHAAGLSRYLETGEGPVINSRIEVPAQNRAGKNFPVELTVVPIGERGGQRFFAFLRDISDRREQEARLRQSALHAEVLWEATELAAAGGTIEELLATCLEKICRVTQWPVGHVYLPDDPFHPQKLVSGSVWYFERPDLEDVAAETARFDFQRGVGLPGQIWASGEPVWVPDIAEGPNLPRKEIWLRRGLHAAFGFPVYHQGRLQAVLEFFSTARQAPDQHLLFVIQSVGQQLGRVLERQRSQEQQQMLLHELSHRVGNSMAVVRSIFRMSSTHASSIEELRESFESRLASMAEAHRLLAASEWRSAALEEIVRAAVEPYCQKAFANCRFSGPALYLPASSVLSMTLVFHELATNAAKYGAFSTPSGSVAIGWKRETPPEGGDQLAIEWREHNPLARADGVGGGYGTRLVDGSVERALGGRISRRFDASGLVVEIVLPMPS